MKRFSDDLLAGVLIGIVGFMVVLFMFLMIKG